MTIPEIDINALLDITIEAGDRILEVYNSDDFGINKKQDDSPLTIADRESHRIIVKRMAELFPDLPLLSEEGKDIPYERRKDWENFWLVDPLDGTKEFIKKNGEFTVNIALIHDNRPVIGIIFAPALGTCYYATDTTGAFKMKTGENPRKIKVNRNTEGGLIAVTSRSHSSEDEKKVLSNFDITESISVGSSLKFCMVAEGRAHVYYRHGPTWEWDTASGHAIAEQAGASISGLSYNKEVMKNGSFLITSPDVSSL